MLDWLSKFSDKQLHAPYVIKKDSDYYKDLRSRYTHFVRLLQLYEADEESISIVKTYSDRVCDALMDYYKGNISSCHRKIQNLVKGCSNNNIGSSTLQDSFAFPGGQTSEIQLFRARISTSAVDYTPKEMLHPPFELRTKTGNYRFSIPGVVSLYLANSSYGCWLETGRPSEHDFNVAPALLDGTQKIFNLAVMTRDIAHLTDVGRVHCWLKLIVLMIA